RGGVAVLIGVHTALGRGPLTRFDSVHPGKLPVADCIADQRVLVVGKPGRFVQSRKRETMAPVQSRRGLLRADVVEILPAAWRGDDRSDLSGAVVDVAA